MLYIFYDIWHDITESPAYNKKEYGRTGKSAKFRYLLRRVFPKAEFYKAYAPIAYKYKILIPAAWFYRLVKAIFGKRKQIRNEMDIVNKL